jgi:hypothetical protein
MIMGTVPEEHMANNRPSQKCLIIYSSYTGNTEKVAARFEITFKKHG